MKIKKYCSVWHNYFSKLSKVYSENIVIIAVVVVVVLVVVVVVVVVLVVIVVQYIF